MKILFTGVSSFTGFWFVRKLSEAGHEVVATCTRGSFEDYLDASVRAQRMQWLADQDWANLRFLYGCRFGDETFVSLIEDGSFDVLAHHGAEVTDYKSPDFDVARAVANNTHNLLGVLNACKSSGCSRIVLTGSVFEGGEGAGSDGLPHFSPYGLSKSLTAEMFKYYCGEAGLRLGKFVIPNPFGPYEEPRFTAYLMRTWAAGETASVKTPDYVRDNIHVSLLACAYVRFIESLSDTPGFRQTNPSNYVETQGAFAQRFAVAMRERLALPCELALSKQTVFSEPRTRLNNDIPETHALNFYEDSAWDELAEYYRAMYPRMSDDS